MARTPWKMHLELEIWVADASMNLNLKNFELKKNFQKKFFLNSPNIHQAKSGVISNSLYQQREGGGGPAKKKLLKMM